MTGAPRYRKKPVVIEAVQFNGSNRREVLSFIYPNLSEDALHGAEVMALPVVIATLEGDMTVSPGDYVIKGVQGEFYPCKPDIFAATYEPAEGPPQGVRQHGTVDQLVRDTGGGLIDDIARDGHGQMRRAD